MSGRLPFRGGRGRFGHGGWGGSGKGHGNTAKTAKKKLEDYTYYVGSNRQASDYEITTGYIINYIKMTYEEGYDIAEALRNLELPDVDLWEPDLRTSLSSDPAIRDRENRQYELKYNKALDEYNRRVRKLRSHKVKTYGLIWNRCAKAMQN